MFWFMLLGCIVPIAVVFMLPVFNVKLGNSLWWIIVLLCPIAHMLMMGSMHGHGNTSMVHSSDQEDFSIIGGNKRPHQP
jgi:hypothetical protein